MRNFYQLTVKFQFTNAKPNRVVQKRDWCQDDAVYESSVFESYLSVLSCDDSEFGFTLFTDLTNLRVMFGVYSSASDYAWYLQDASGLQPLHFYLLISFYSGLWS